MDKVERKKTQLTSEEENELFHAFPLPTYGQWKESVEKSLKGAPFEKLITPTYEGIDVKPLYQLEDVEHLPHVSSFPGFSPYLRATDVLGYGETSWGISQELTAGTPEAFNRSARHDLERGQTVLHIVLDRPTRSGLDADEAKGEDVGTDGLSLSTLSDIETAVAGINLEEVPVFVQGEGAFSFLALLAAYMRRNKAAVEKLSGCIGMDPLAALVSEGYLRSSLADQYDKMAALTFWSIENAPALRTITIQGHPYHDGGGSAVQELAFVLATGVEYVREMLARGFSVDEAASRMVFSMSIGSNFFMETAKFRAARLLWATIIQEFGGSEAAGKMKVHGRTSAWTKTVYDPYVNMLRGTVEAFAGVVGGVDSMHVSPFDEAIRPADEFSRRIARNAQLILEKEAHLSRVIDPAGGSWYVESLTDSLAQKAWALFQEVEAKGGMYKALTAKFPQAQVGEVAAKRAANIGRRKDKFVGTNMYPNLKEPPLKNNAAERISCREERVADLKKARSLVNQAALNESLAQLEQTRGEASAAVVEAAINAMDSGATLGDIAKAFTVGKQEEVKVEAIRAWRGAQPFEQLRAAAEQYRERTGAFPTVFLANLGPVPKHKARADFAAGFFEAGGFAVLTNSGFTGAEEAARAAVESNASIVVICSSDDLYPEFVPPLASRIKDANPDITVLLAGNPDEEQRQGYQEAGVDDFINIKSNCYEILAALQKEKGVAL